MSGLIDLIHVVPFRPEHLAEMVPQAVQRELATNRLSRGRMLAVAGQCFTAFAAADGAVMMCGGAIQSHAQHATMWAAFAEGACDRRREMAAVRQRTRWLLAKLTHRRIDTAVRSDHRGGHAFVHALGFVPEAEIGDLFEDGGDAIMYRMKR